MARAPGRRVQCSTRRPRPHIAPALRPRRRLPAPPHHASAGRAARAAGQAREPAAAGRVAGGRRHRAGLPPGASGGAGRVRLLPLVRERTRAQPARDPGEPAGEARLHAGAQHDGAAATARAGRPHGALRAPAAVARRAGRRTSPGPHLRHPHRAGRLPRPHR